MFRIEKAQLNGYYIEILNFKNHLDVLFIELKKENKQMYGSSGKKKVANI